MSKDEQVKFSIISDFIRRRITRSEAALLLDTTERTITRLARKIDRGGMPGIKHANTGVIYHFLLTHFSYTLLTKAIVHKKRGGFNSPQPYQYFFL